MRGWWYLHTGLFQPKTCEMVISEAMKLKPIDGVIGHGGKAHTNDKVRHSTIRWVPQQLPALMPLRSRIMEFIHEANANIFGFDLSHLPNLQFTEYRSQEKGADKDQHYGWHEDLSWKTDLKFHRKLSFVMQLTDPRAYKGGDLELAEDPIEPKRLRPQGTVIVFPSFLKHRVTPVTSGVRYSLVGWVEGPTFR